MTDRNTRLAFGPAAAPTKHALMGLRYWDGENGGGGGTNPPATPPPAPPQNTPTPTPPPAPTPTPQPAATDQPRSYGEDYVRELRQEAKDRREALQAAEQARQAAERERDELRAWRADAQRRDVVRDIAGKPEVGADATRLLDSKAFDQATKDMDWNDATKVQAAVTQFLEAHPSYKAAAPGPGSSGPTHHAGGTPPNASPRSLEEAVASAYGSQG